jgi:hypothetical protein
MKYLLMIVVTISTMLSGCAGIPIDTKIANQNSQTWQIKEVTAFKKDGIVKVSGHFKKSKSFAVRKGHIDIVVLTNDGKVFLRNKAPIGIRAMRRGGDYFSTELPNELPENALIQVEFHNQNKADYEDSH